MSEPVRLQFPDGQEVWARVTVDDGPSDVSWRDTAAALQLDDLTDTVRAVASSVHSAVTAARPDQLSVEFRIELAAKSGKVVSILAEAAAKASLRVTLSWDRDGAAPATSDDDDGDGDPATGPVG
ncbi:CU044_2847 family protein [Dactylosporangium sp. McL0621]|uniref:CU044_2847 family protein n=1 Tax=Dactylosporangium sp. McL0621 TaxID=3415678 RepID=UPI003CE7B870